jgi:sulfur relay (sulfurtransferase) DsrC/TusE family protein
MKMYYKERRNAPNIKCIIKDARQRPRKERSNTQKFKCIIKRGVMPKT